MDLAEHEKKCRLPKCLNFKFCERYVDERLYKNEKVCDANCLLLAQLQGTGDDLKAAKKCIVVHMKKFYNQVPGQMGAP